MKEHTFNVNLYTFLISFISPGSYFISVNLLNGVGMD